MKDYGVEYNPQNQRGIMMPEQQSYVNYQQQQMSFYKTPSPQGQHILEQESVDSQLENGRREDIGPMGQADGKYAELNDMPWNRHQNEDDTQGSYKESDESYQPQSKKLRIDMTREHTPELSPEQRVPDEHSDKHIGDTRNLSMYSRSENGFSAHAYYANAQYPVCYGSQNAYYMQGQPVEAEVIEPGAYQ